MMGPSPTHNQAEAVFAETDDEVLRVFLLGRGHKAMRAYVRRSRDSGWPRANCRFVMEALYSRFGQIVRGGTNLEDLRRLRRSLQELLTECNGASPDFKARVAGISELIADFINQEGGVNNTEIFDDPHVWRIVALLESGKEVDEAELIEAVGAREAFIQAISSLIVADLVTFSEKGEDGWAYRLSNRGHSRLKVRRSGDPLRALFFEPEDLRIWTPVQPIFDMMILPFAQAVVDRTHWQTSAEARLLVEFGVEVDRPLMERPLQEWQSSDEAFLVPRSRHHPLDSHEAIGAITLPRVKLSPMASKTSIDVAVGNTFFGFHLLVARSALKGLWLRRSIPKSFPDELDEVLNVVPWADFGEWLRRNDLRARIMGDRATHDFFTKMMPFSPGALELVDLESVESNSGRLEGLKRHEPGVITLAVATGPLLAIAREAGLYILTPSWSILDSARRGGLTYEEASQIVFKQYILIGVSQDAFESDSRAEDAVYRAMLFTEATYRLIVAETDLFANYCALQWEELQKNFDKTEFDFKLSLKDIEFALRASYRWLGHDLDGLVASDEWPASGRLRDCTYWTKSDEVHATWPQIKAKLATVEARVDALTERAMKQLPSFETDMRSKLMARVKYLKQIGCLRQTERALSDTIENLQQMTEASKDRHNSS